MEERPVFVRGFSRSGGTLLVTILDAHPDLAMSYELYPNLLEEPGLDPAEAAATLRKAWTWRTAGWALKRAGYPGFSTFALRCDRGGMTTGDLAGALEAHRAEGLDFSTVEGRMRFIRRCAVHKMRACGKRRWGLKCSNRYRDYLCLWPQAHFLNVLRDGRDVLASQLHTGGFRDRKTPAQIGEGWARTYRRFRAVAQDPAVRTCTVRYERLVGDPEAEVRRVSEFLGLEFADAMLRFHQQDLTIYGAASHLSMKRIKRPVDASKVGRWQRDVTAAQLRDFLAAARDVMVQAGYLDEHDAD